MNARFFFLAAPALVLLAGCEGAIGVGGAIGTPGLSASAPAAVAAPAPVDQCGQLAGVAADPQAAEDVRQAAIQESARLACPV